MSPPNENIRTTLNQRAGGKLAVIPQKAWAACAR